MRWNHFTGTLVFGALAAALLPAVWLVAGPILGVQPALSLYVVFASALYAAGLAPTRRRALAVGLCAALGGGLVLLAARSLAEVAIGAALVVAVSRSAFLFRARPMRALVLELALSLGGLLVARFLASPGLIGTSLAVWGYFLVQSGFFLVAGVAERERASGEEDPFDRAHSRLLSLLEEEA